MAQESNVEHRIQVDSLLWTNPDTIPSYPYQAKLDSVLNEQTNAIKKAYENDSTACCLLPFEPIPRLYVIDENGNKLSGKDAKNYWNDILPEDFWVVIEFLVEWNGTISEIKLKMYKDDISGVNLSEIVQKVSAEPDSLYGFPAPKQTRMNWILSGE